MKLTQFEPYRKSVTKILKTGGVKRAALFGSWARNQAKKKSDLDLVIEFSGKKKDLFDLVHLKIVLEEETGLKIDLVTYKSLHPLLKDSILKEQVILL